MGNAGVRRQRQCGGVAAFKDHVKAQLFQGRALADPHGIFNAGLDAKATRAIDIHEGDAIDAPAIQDLVRAVALNTAGKRIGERHV